MIRRSLLLGCCTLGLAVAAASCASGSSTDETPVDQGPGAGGSDAGGGSGGSASGGKGGKSGSSTGGSGGAAAGASGSGGGVNCATFCAPVVQCGATTDADCQQLCAKGISAECASCAQAAGADCAKLKACGAVCGSGTGGSGGGGGGGGMSGGNGGTSGGSGGAMTGGSSGSSGASAGSAGSSTGGASGAAGASGASGKAGSSGGGNGGAAGACSDQPELCNGIDDNCNGVIDEGDPEAGTICTVPGAKGECQAGILHCKKGGKLTCEASVQPSPEICDGLDNDCNGLVDDMVQGEGDSCDTGKKGICKAGSKACESGKIVCKQNLEPMAEACNGLDDNCDGQIDEGSPGAGNDCTVPGFPAGSPCAKGKTGCGASGQITCVQAVMPEPEKCDGIDNDCNGTIDDPASVTNQPCSTGLQGVCADGSTSCVAGVPACVVKVKPNTLPEICNGLDDDCDGQVDNDANPANDNALCSGTAPNAQYVSTWTCATGGKCQITACQTGHADIDGASGNGCECAADQYGTACANASTVGVSFNATVSKTGVIASDNGEAWFHVTFNGPNAAGATIHFQVELTNDGGGQYAMDALQACGQKAQCPLPGNDPAKTMANSSGPDSINIWDFKSTYDANCTMANACNDASPIPVDMYFRIHSNTAASCNPYTVAFRSLTQ